MSTYNDEEYWNKIQEQERNEEEARCKAKMELEDKMNAEKPAKRIWTEEEIKNYVQTNDTVLYRALKKLYDCQTEDEQRSGETIEHNGVGFNGVDAEFLSSTAEFLARTGFLTEKQKIYVRKKLVKYTKQLTRLANA